MGVADALENELKIPHFLVVVDRCRRLIRPRGANGLGYIGQLMTTFVLSVTHRYERDTATKLYWPGLPARGSQQSIHK